MILGRLPIRSITVLFLAGLCAGCATLFQPYLNSSPLDQASSCDPVPANSDSGAVGRFKAVRAGVCAMRKQAQDSYIERARLNTVSSALAFPVVGVLLYRGATVNTDNGRNAVLKGALAAGAAYEARNALLSGSPESIYILSEARLACVLDEAAKYRLDVPVGQEQQTCNGMADALNLKIDALEALKIPSAPNLAPYATRRDALVTQARNAISQYNATEATLASASDKMQATARKIVTDTNAQIRTPSISPATATALLKSEMALFSPAGALPEDPGKTTQDRGGSSVNVVDAINALSRDLNTFGRSCLRPQPASVSPFDACTTYSPTAPPAPNITTTLEGNKATLKPGDQLVFTATSNPSGTPWATYANNASVAQQALGDLQQITLSPTQTRVTLTYDKAKPVSTDAEVTLRLDTMGVTGNPTAVKLTLKAAEAVTGAGDQAKTGWSPVTGDTALMAKLQLPATATGTAVQAALQTKWRASCGAAATVTPKDSQLVDPAFLTALKNDAKPDPNQAFCK